MTYDIFAKKIRMTCLKEKKEWLQRERTSVMTDVFLVLQDRYGGGCDKNNSFIAILIPS